MAGSHEIRCEVIFMEQDSTCTLIQFSIALSIKTWNCFSEFQWPTRSRHPSNRPLRTYVSTTLLAYSSSDSERWFFSVIFFCYVVNQLSSSRELQCDFFNRWQNHIFENKTRSQLQQCAIIRMSLVNIRSHFRGSETRLSLLGDS